MVERSSLAALALLLSPAVSAAGDVWIVDSLGGADFLQIRDAVGGAQDGDTILVRPWEATKNGRYDAFTIDDKDLRVVAETWAVVNVEAVQVRNTDVSREVVLSGLAMRNDPSPSGYAYLFLVEDCLGPVRVTRCQMTGNAKTPFGGGVTLAGSPDVVLDRCFSWPGSVRAISAGIAVVDSRVALYECFAIGNDEFTWRPDEGSPGLFVSASEVFVSRGRFVGGVGPYTCPLGSYGRGGPGVLIQDGSKVVATEHFLVGGEGGWGGFSYFDCHPDAGPKGYDQVVEAGSVLALHPGPALRIGLEPALVRDTDVELRLSGLPGEELVLRRSERTVFEPLLADRGLVHVPEGMGNPGIHLGTLPASGEMTVTLPLRQVLAKASVKSLLPEDPVGTLYLQVEGTSPPGGARFGNVIPLTHYAGALLPTSHAHVVHVDADAPPGGDGRTWETAYQDLQDAVSETGSISRLYPMALVEVWVAGGRYTPGDDPEDYFSFEGAGVYGGFLGSEARRDERDWVANETILSGDILGDDDGSFENRGDNSERVVSTVPANPNLSPDWPFEPPNAVFDGFTVEGAEDRAMVAGGAHVRHCRIRGNRSSNPNEDGAAGLSAVRSTVTKCSFSRNESMWGAGALRLYSGFGYPTQSFTNHFNASVQSCSFTQNSGRSGAASLTGEGVDTSVSMANCLFVSNSGVQAGAVQARVVVQGVTRKASVHIDGCTFFDNHASSPSKAGGVHVILSGEPGEARVSNSILWKNTTNDVVDELAQVKFEELDIGAPYSVDYSCVSGFATLPGTGTHGFDPHFVDPLGPDLIPGTGDENMNLDAGSPCADAGDNARIPPDAGDLDEDGDRTKPIPFDLEGKPRRADDEVPDKGAGEPPIVDMGALERAKGAGDG